MIGYAFLALALYLGWWHFRCFRGRFDIPYGYAPSRNWYREKFNSPIARLLMAKGSDNFAVTLPHPFRRRAVVMYAKHYARANHRRHELAGHVPQVFRLGPLNYLPTYLWHVAVLRRRARLAFEKGEVVPPVHQMEREAVEREKALQPNPFGDLGTP